jgi:uncharacterized membrane protein
MLPSAEQDVRKEDRVGSWIFLHSSLVAALIVGAGLVVRLRLASETFLHADEALHFMAANQNSWRLSYQASLTLSHPPLLIAVLHIWRTFGTSEIILRMPSVLAGTAFCWIFFKWLSDVLGTRTGLIGVILASFLPPMIALSAEVRQYALLLFFAICAIYLLERALDENSVGKMLLSSVCSWLAILSHYSAVLLAATLGVYSLLRMLPSQAKPAWVGHPPSRTVFGVWVGGQIGALLLCSFLYFTYISAFGRSALHSWMDVYLHNSYFDRSRHQVFLFAATRSISVFQYLFGQNVIGDLMFLFFVAGVVLVLRTKGSEGLIQVSKGELACLLVLPFAINCAAALADVYPYGGTRHCVFLAIFAIAGISFAMYRLVGRRLERGLAAAALIIVLCNIFPSRRLPYIARADQKMAHMQDAVGFIREHIPRNDVLFADNQTSLLLGHYLCQQKPFFINQWTAGLKSLQCGGYRIVGTDGRTFAFSANNFFQSWNDLVRAYNLKAGDSVWVLQEGWLWEDPLARQLKGQYAEFHDLNTYSFGHNITIFQLTVPVPIQSSKQETL